MTEKNRKPLETENNEQVLSNYVDNRIKLMQEVLSLIRPKKIITMAPDFMKNMQMSTVKSLLLEELLGISNKRLRNILAGENKDADSSSSESEEEVKKAADTISLQEITDDSDCCIDIELSEHERLELEKDNASISKTTSQIKIEPKKGIKRKEKDNGKHKKKSKHNKKIPKSEEEPVVNVLNLLELQARARAIRSQLANEMIVDVDKNMLTVNVVKPEKTVSVLIEPELKDEDSSNSVICVSPDNLSVVSIDSNSDLEDSLKSPNDENKKKASPDRPKTSKNNVVDSTNFDKTLEKTHKQNNRDESGADPWKTRWLESKKVMDVMRTTKLYNNLRQSRKLRKISPGDNSENKHFKTNNGLTDNRDSVDKNSEFADMNSESTATHSESTATNSESAEKDTESTGTNSEFAEKYSKTAENYRERPRSDEPSS